MTTKTCSKCGQEKSLDLFYKVSSTGKPRSNCKACEGKQTRAYSERRREKRREWYFNQYWKDPDKARKQAVARYHRNKDAILAKKKKRRVDDRNKLLMHYSGGKMECACCGEREKLFLSLDHINNDGAEHRRNYGGRKSFSADSFARVLIKEGFPNGLQVLCMNCNWGKRMNNGVCPHKSHEGSETIRKE